MNDLIKLQKIPLKWETILPPKTPFIGKDAFGKR